MLNNLNPIPMLMAMAQGRNPNAASAGGGTPPAPVSPAQPPAPTPQALPPAAEGGGGSRFAGIGGRISQALNGERGLFQAAPDAAAESELDPLTGVPRGLSRRANNQALMRVGLLLMASGARQSDDSRAAILANVAGAADTSSTINNFAQNRLEMAKLKLAEREQLAQAQSLEAMNNFMGIPPAGGADPRVRAIQAGASPVSGTAADPGAAIPASTPQGLPETAPRGTIATAADGQSYQYAETSGMGGRPQGSWGWIRAGAAPNAPAAPIGQGVENPVAAPVPGSSLPKSAPPPPMVAAADGTWQPTEAERRIFMMLPTPDAKAKFIADRNAAFTDTEIESAPYLQPNVGVVVDVYKAGRKIGTNKIGDATSTFTPDKQPDGSVIWKATDGLGNVTQVQTVRDPVADRARTIDMEQELGPTGEGQRLVRDPVTNAPSYENVPGGKAEREAAAAESMAAEKNATVVAGADQVSKTIRKAISKVENQTWYNPVSGFGGSLLASLPLGGTAARDYAELESMIGANIAFDRLSRMRAESKHGGALGSVTEGELKLLKDTMGSISQAQSEPQLLEHLTDLEEIYSGIIRKFSAYPNAAEYGLKPAESGNAGLPKIGDEVDGYIYLGGDPNAQESYRAK